MADRDPSPQALAGRSAVVTGASSGIGKSIAIRLAEAGADVLVHAGRRRENAEEVAARIRSLGRESTVLLADFCKPDEVSAFVDAAWKWRDDIHIWVNNAGADVLTGERTDADFWEKLDLLWQVDVRAAMEIARNVGKRMQDRQATGEPPSIVTIGWDQADVGMAGDAGEMFATIKGAVMAFTKSLARSLAPHVRVNCVAPGWIKTSWGAGASEYWQRRAVAESLLARWGEPHDIAEAVAFLASPQASFITGQIVKVNGGFRHSE